VLGTTCTSFGNVFALFLVSTWALTYHQQSLHFCKYCWKLSVNYLPHSVTNMANGTLNVIGQRESQPLLEYVVTYLTRAIWPVLPVAEQYQSSYFIIRFRTFLTRQHLFGWCVLSSRGQAITLPLRTSREGFPEKKYLTKCNSFVSFKETLRRECCRSLGPGLQWTAVLFRS
jgi:hypothetical protein